MKKKSAKKIEHEIGEHHSAHLKRLEDGHHKAHIYS